MNNEKITQITLTNGDVVNINTDISLKAMRYYKAQGILDGGFITGMLGGKNNGVDSSSVYNAPYVAYKEAGGTMTQDEFEDLLPLDETLFINIYTQLFVGASASQADKNNFRQHVKRATGK